jgi:hypothetical protein
MNNDFYYKPVIVGDKIALLVTHLSGSLSYSNVAAIYYDGEYYFARHTYNDNMRYATATSSESGILNIVNGVETNGSYDVFNKSWYWSK